MIKQQWILLMTTRTQNNIPNQYTSSLHGFVAPKECLMILLIILTVLEGSASYGLFADNKEKVRAVEKRGKVRTYDNVIDLHQMQTIKYFSWIYFSEFS